MSCRVWILKNPSSARSTAREESHGFRLPCFLLITLFVLFPASLALSAAPSDAVQACEVPGWYILSAFLAGGICTLGILKVLCARNAWFIQSCMGRKDFFRDLFETSKLALWQEDMSAVKVILDDLKEQGVTDFHDHFSTTPADLERCLTAIRIVDVNKAAIELHAAQSREHLMENLAYSFTEKSWPTFADEMACLASGSRHFKSEGAIRTLEGETVDIMIYADIATGFENCWSNVLITMVDISDKKRYEDAVVTERDKAKQYLDIAASIIVALDPSGIITLINQTGSRTLGYAEGELEGKSWFEHCIPQEYRKEAKEMLLSSLVAQFDEDTIFESPVLCSDGSYRFISWKSAVIRDRDGAALGNLIAGEDVTDRRRTEKLEQARVRLMQYATSHPLDKLMIAIIDEAEFITDSQIGFYHFLMPDQNTLILQAWSTNTTNSMCKTNAKGAHYSISAAGVWVDCVHQRKAVIHNDYETLPHRKGMPDGHAPVTRELLVPVFRNGNIVAIIGVGNKRTNYTQADVEIVSLLGDIAADIIERKQSQDTITKALALNETLAELYEPLVSPNLTIESASSAVLAEAQNLIGSQCGLAGIITPTGDFVAQTITYMGRECPDLEKHQTPSFCPYENDSYKHLWGQSLNTKEPFLSNNPREADSWNALPEGHLAIDNILAVPVVLGSTVVAELMLANKPGGFVDQDLFAAQRIAEFYALAILRVREQHELTKSEHKYRTIVETMLDGLVIVGIDGIISFANTSLLDMLGREMEEVLKTPVMDIFPQREGETFLQRIHSPGKPGATSFYSTLLSKDGYKVPVLVSPAPLFNEKSEFTGAVALFTNITELKMLEAQLLHAQKLESIGQLAAGIAHEINTPAQYVGNNIRFLSGAFTELLEIINGTHFASELDPDHCQHVQQYLKQLTSDSEFEYLSTEIPSAINETIEGVERISAIVQSVKAFAHPGSEELRAADINEAVRSTITVSTNEWKYVANLEASYDESMPLVPCLVGDLNQVVLNLIVNAAHAIEDKIGPTPKEKGSITVSTAVEDDSAVIRIRDSGCGIKEEVQDRIFDPFFTTKEVGKGSGQGLSICRTMIVEKHGGELYFTTEEGVGSEFVIKIPLTAKGES